MNYYPHHIGDFNSATRNLSWTQKFAYRELIEFYYDSEKPIFNNLDDICFRVGAKTEEQKDAVNLVLKHFFREDGDYYYHDRCEAEILHYKSKRESQSKAGKASAAARKATKEQRTLNVRQPTNNHKPKTSNQFKRPTLQDCADHIAGKVNNPMSTAEEFYNHFEASGWMVKGGVKMKSWRAALNGWVTRGQKYEANRRNQTTNKSDKNDEALRKLYS